MTSLENQFIFVLHNEQSLMNILIHLILQYDSMGYRRQRTLLSGLLELVSRMASRHHTFIMYTQL